MEFVQPTEPSINNPTLPSVAMNFNGVYLEEALDGYSTLNVSGRELLGYDIQSERRSHGHGSIRYGKTLPSRTLTIQYRLKADSAEELQEKFDQLRRILYSTDIVPIQFRDEPGITYYGEFEGADSVPPDRLVVVSNFTLFCPEPFKWRNKVTTNGGVLIGTFYPTIPDKITVETDSATGSIDITNGEQTIQLRGQVNAGSIIEIDIANQDVKVNGTERLDLIDLHSDFENFTIENGQTVTSTNGMLKIEMREVV
jgi:predicted phage tail component-like protein